MSTWLPVLTLVLGSALTFAGGLMSESYRSRTARRLRMEEREVQAAELRRSSYRDTLLNLQDAGSALLEATDSVFDVKLRMVEESQSWPPEARIDAELRRVRRVARHRTEILASRILDDELRKQLNDALACEQVVTHSLNRIEATDALELMRERFAAANQQLGTVLRTLL